MQSILWFLVWFALFAGVSTSSGPVGSPSTPPPVPTTGEAMLNEPFTLAYGSSAALDDGNLAVTFAQVVEDSRCPADVMCAWSGQVIVALEVTAGETAQTVELGGISDSEGVLRPSRPELATVSSTAVGEYTVELLAVTPYPAHAAEPPSAEEYTLSLVVRR